LLAQRPRALKAPAGGSLPTLPASRRQLSSGWRWQHSNQRNSELNDPTALPSRRGRHEKPVLCTGFFSPAIYRCQYFMM